MNTTIFDDFINSILGMNLEEAYNMHEAVSYQIGYGSYQCFERNGILVLIDQTTNNRLRLVSARAKYRFLRLLNDKWGGSFKDVCTNWDFKQAISKDN